MEKKFFYEDSRLKNLEKLDNIYIYLFYINEENEKFENLCYIYLFIKI